MAEVDRERERAEAEQRSADIWTLAAMEVREFGNPVVVTGTCWPVERKRRRWPWGRKR